ncbi:phage portal protein family protein [Bacteroides acidifaciens]|uniref:phage portal protein family protein n=2 Tax=Bacteroides acidifaciens TaxID=85831 RepID=UPI0030147F28
MYKKLREIFNWFQQKAIRRMSLRNVLNEYYFRMDGSGAQSASGASYKRQAVVYREKTIDDWIMSVTSATDPDDPRRGLLYRFYQSLYNDEHLQTTIDNRVLPVQQAEFMLVDDNDNEDKEAKKLLDRPWYHQLIRICFLHQLQGVSLADISHLDDNLEISHVEEVPMSNYIPQQMIIVKEESDKTGWSYKDGALEPYYVQFGNAWALGMLNELAVIILAKKLGLGSWMNYIEKYGIPPVFVTSDRQDKKRLDELFEMMQDFRNNFFAVLSGNEKVEYGKEAGGNTTNAFLPLEERCDNQISKRLLGQTGTTENGAWEGTAEVHERVEKSRHEYDKMIFQFYFNYVIIPKLVKISPVYKPLERLKLKWDDTESLSITEYIEAINKLAYTFEFDHKEVAKKTGLPIIGQKKNPGGEQQGGTLPNQPQTDPQKKRPNRTMKR